MPLDEIENIVDKVVAPDRIIRWIVRIVLLIVLCSVGAVVLKLALHSVDKVERATIDRDWFVQQKEAIDAARLEEKAAREALSRHKAEVKARSGVFSFSHKDDRLRTDALNNSVLAVQKKQLALTRDYNTRAGQVVDVTYLQGLPKRISLGGGG